MATSMSGRMSSHRSDHRSGHKLIYGPLPEEDAPPKKAPSEKWIPYKTSMANTNNFLFFPDKDKQKAYCAARFLPPWRSTLRGQAGCGGCRRPYSEGGEAGFCNAAKQQQESCKRSANCACGGHGFTREQLDKLLEKKLDRSQPTSPREDAILCSWWGSMCECDATTLVVTSAAADISIEMVAPSTAADGAHSNTQTAAWHVGENLECKPYTLSLSHDQPN